MPEDHSMILDQANLAFQNEPGSKDVEVLEEMEVPEEMEESEDEPKDEPYSHRALHTREVDQLIASVIKLRTEMSTWDATQFAANEIGVQYDTLHNLIPIPMDPASAPASPSAGAATPCTYSHSYAKISGNLESVQVILDRGKREFQDISGPKVQYSTLATPFRRWVTSKHLQLCGRRKMQAVESLDYCGIRWCLHLYRSTGKLRFSCLVPTGEQYGQLRDH
ncbi:hypothetical protein Q9L58_006267 [Maublancomyces gigas]|uniref:Uncharacterized protein n=1 Tax=Discina gigas TaxID=1032678 RepID=A0ABR3GFY0_9PEZI